MVREVRIVEEVEIPENVSVEVNGSVVKVSGPKGTIERDFSHAKKVRISLQDRKVVVETHFARRKDKAVVYAVAAHIRNMITGVTKGYRYWLKIIYSHFPITVKVEGDKVLIVNFLGEKSPRVAKIVGSAKVKVQRNDVIVEGINIEEVGQTAANIEQATKISGFDRRVFVDGIYIYKKEFMEG
ncbi:MAG: 50S ribosomal protein L6 [Desulfurococcales archaeon]|nr:50S ribosomal protein L6 [Desulfurococcales archaeon]